MYLYSKLVLYPNQFLREIKYCEIIFTFLNYLTNGVEVIHEWYFAYDLQYRMCN